MWYCFAIWIVFFRSTDFALHRSLLRGEEGLDFIKFSVYLLISFLGIHLVTLFNLPCIHILVME